VDVEKVKDLRGDSHGLFWVINGIGLGYGLDDRGVRVPARAGGFFS